MMKKLTITLIGFMVGIISWGQQPYRFGGDMEIIGNISAYAADLVPTTVPSEVEGRLYYRNSDDLVLVFNGVSWDTLNLSYEIRILSLENDTVSLGTIAPLNSDTFTIYVFGTEGSSRFTTGATYQYGLYHNDGSDTLVMIGTHSLMQGTTPSLGMNIAWHATAFSGSATEAWTSDQTITSITTGDLDLSPNNYYILPGDHVWFKTPTVGTAPDYAYVGLLVQRLNRSF